MSKYKYALGSIGGGNMAEAILTAAVGQSVLPAESILVCDPIADRRAVFQALGMSVTDSSDQVVRQADQLLLAIKPQMLDRISGALAGVGADQVLISIMAGIGTGRLERMAGGSARVVRVMPNTPLLVGHGMSALCTGAHAGAEDPALARQLFAAAGKVVEVAEDHMDAVTAVSGSGPAYVFYLAEAMVEAGLKLGLPSDLVPMMVEQTVHGAAELLCRSEHDAGVLRAKVTSPGGTTEAAISHKDEMKVKMHIVHALEKAAIRSRELGG